MQEGQRTEVHVTAMNTNHLENDIFITKINTKPI